MRLPLAREIAHARALFEGARDAVPYLTRLDHAVTATHVVLAGAADDGRPGADLLEALEARYPELGPLREPLPLDAHLARLLRVRAALSRQVEAFGDLNANLSGLLHEQGHLAMDPLFEDMLVELAELDAAHTAIEAQLELPAQRLQWLGITRQTLEMLVDLARAPQRPEADPLGTAAYQAGMLANAYGTAAQQSLTSLDLRVQLAPPPLAPARVDPDAADAHWSALASVTAAIDAVLDAIRRDEDEVRVVVNALVAEQSSLRAKIQHLTG